MNHFQKGDVVYYKGKYPIGSGRYRFVTKVLEEGNQRTYHLEDGLRRGMESHKGIIHLYDLIERGCKDPESLTKVLNKLL